MFVTNEVNEKMEQNPIFSLFVFESLLRFVSRDWGEVSPEDAADNNAAPEYAWAHTSTKTASKSGSKLMIP